MYKNDEAWKRSWDRAIEACNHGARHTFIEPESLLFLIASQKEVERLRNLIADHMRSKEKEEYNVHDDFLWVQD